MHVDLSELSTAGPWTLEHNGQLASYQEQPATLKWEGMTDFLAIIFETNDVGGSVRLRWDGQEDTLDLYAANPTNYLYLAGPSVSAEHLALRTMQALALFTLLLLVTSLFEPSRIAFGQEAVTFTTATIDGTRMALSAAGSRGHWIALAAVFGLGVTFRAFYLNEPVRYDEAYTFLHFASKPFSDAVSNYFVPNNHLLNTVSIRVFHLLLGTAPWIIRLPAFIAGILLIPACYLMARVHYGKEVGLLALPFGIPLHQRSRLHCCVPVFRSAIEPGDLPDSKSQLVGLVLVHSLQRDGIHRYSRIRLTLQRGMDLAACQHHCRTGRRRQPQ
jgi:hypothetical protein